MIRMGRDSNPRYLSVHTLSRRAQSTALAPILQESGFWIRMGWVANEIAQPTFPPTRGFDRFDSDCGFLGSTLPGGLRRVAPKSLLEGKSS
jgi:hypothetical protein